MGKRKPFHEVSKNAFAPPCGCDVCTMLEVTPKEILPVDVDPHLDTLFGAKPEVKVSLLARLRAAWKAFRGYQ